MSYSTKKIPILLIVAFVLVFGTALAYAYLVSQNNLASNRLGLIDREILDVQRQIKEAADSQTAVAQTALNTLETIRGTEIAWSVVLASVQKIIPLDIVNLRPMVEFSTYSGQANGVLTFNGNTSPEADVRVQLNAIAQTIQTFNESGIFKDAFVPSISRSVNQNNQTVLSFVFNASYVTQRLQQETGSVPVQRM